MQKLEQLYEGKAKKVFRTDDPELYIVDYKDDATAFNGLKKGTITGITALMKNELHEPEKLAEHLGKLESSSQLLLR